MVHLTSDGVSDIIFMELEAGIEKRIKKSAQGYYTDCKGLARLQMWIGLIPKYFYIAYPT